jgi:hypothetical protein
MARAPKAALTKSSTSTAVIPWEQEFETATIAAAEMEKNTGGGQFFSTQGGVLSFGGQSIKNNRMSVIILDSMFENIFYEGKYDPQNPTPPTCFAFGYEEDTLAPHKVVKDLGQDQNPQCRGCPMNAWASADTGRGKACRNTRRLALLAAGSLDDNDVFTPERDFSAYGKLPLGSLKIPVTSVNGYGSFVKMITSTLRRPPHGVFTRITMVPDPKTQFKLLFEAIGPVPEAAYRAYSHRLSEAREMNLVPPDMTPPVAKPEAPSRRAPAVRRTVKR